MQIRLGYVSISKTLEVTPSTTITYTEYLKNNDLSKIDQVIKSNLNDLEKIMIYNIKNGIHFYRLTSKLIPLATKEDIVFDYITPYQKYYDRIGQLIKENDIRVDVHPDQFCVLNSTKKEVVDNTFKILEYHYNILEALGIKDKIIILHVGSSVFGKENSIKRFIHNFNKLPKHIQKCIAVENDDKVYNIKDCLTLCKNLNIPFVLDYHHYICNHNELIEDYFIDIFKTWEKTNLNPKMHFSSPKNKSKKDFRSHHDYIDIYSFLDFLNKIKDLPFNIDIMLEAKAKDEALFRLTRLIKYYTNNQFINDTTFFI